MFKDQLSKDQTVNPLTPKNSSLPGSKDKTFPTPKDFSSNSFTNPINKPPSNPNRTNPQSTLNKNANFQEGQGKIQGKTKTQGGVFKKNAENIQRGQYDQQNKKKKQQQKELQFSLSYIYLRLQKEQKLTKKDIQKIEINYSIIVSNQTKQNHKKQLQKLNGSLPLQQIFSGYQSKEEILKYWFLILSEFLKKHQFLNINTAIKLLREHINYNLKKYQKNSQIIMQIIEIGKNVHNYNEIQKKKLFIIKTIQGLQIFMDTFIKDFSIIFSNLNTEQIDYKLALENIWKSFKALCKIQSKSNIQSSWLSSMVKSMRSLINYKERLIDHHFLSDYINNINNWFSLIKDQTGKQAAVQLAIKLLTKEKQWNPSIIQTIKSIKDPQLLPFCWLGKQKYPNQFWKQPKYFVVEGAYWQPLIDQIIRFSSEDKQLLQTLFRSICSIIGQNPRKMWNDLSSYQTMIDFIEFYLSNLDSENSFRKIALLMNSCIGSKGQCAYQTFNYFCSNILLIQEKELYMQFLQIRNKSRILEQRTFETRKNKYDTSTDHIIYTFLLKLLESEPKLLNQLTKIVKTTQQTLLNVLIRQYLIKLSPQDTKQIQSVFKALKSLLNCKSTKEVALAQIRMPQNLNIRQKVQQTLQKIVSNYENNNALADHISYMMENQKQLGQNYWIPQMLKLLNKQIQTLNISQLGSYCKIANKYYQNLLISNQNQPNYLQKRLKIIINEQIITTFLIWCFQMNQKEDYLFCNKLLLQSKFDILWEAIQLLKVLTLCDFRGLLSQRMKRHLNPLNTQIQLNQQYRTSYAVCLVSILCNSPQHFQKMEESFPLLKQQLTNVLNLRLKKDKKVNLAIYECGYRTTEVADYRNSQSTKNNLYCDYLQKLKDHLQNEYCPSGLQLALQLNILSNEQIYELAKRLKIWSHETGQILSKLVAFSQYVKKFISDQKTKKNIIQFLNQIGKQIKPFLSKKFIHQPKVRIILDNIWEAFFTTQLKNTVFYVQLLERYMDLLLHPHMLLIYQNSDKQFTLYFKVLSLTFTSYNFLSEDQFKNLINKNPRILQFTIILVQKAAEKGQQHICLFGCRFLIKILRVESQQKNQIPPQVVYSMQLLVENYNMHQFNQNLPENQNPNGRSIVLLILSGLILSKVPNQQFQLFVQNQILKSRQYSCILMPFIGECKNKKLKTQVVRIALKSFQLTFLNPVFLGGICSFLLQLILNGEYIEEILRTLSIVIESNPHSHLMTWCCTFMFYIMKQAPLLTSKITKYLFTSSVIMEKISSLLNCLTPINWMGIQSKNKQSGLSLVEKGQLLSIFKCLSVCIARYDNSSENQNINQESTEYIAYNSLCLSILKGLNSIINLQSSVIKQTCSYELQLHLFAARSMIIQQSSLRMNDEEEQISILMILNHHFNAQIYQIYMLMLKKAYKLKTIKADDLNEQKLLQIADMLVKSIISYNKERQRNQNILKNIQQRIYDSFKFSKLMYYTNIEYVHQQLATYKEILQNSLILCLTSYKYFDDNLRKISKKYKDYRLQYQSIIKQVMRIQSQKQKYEKNFKNQRSTIFKSILSYNQRK